MADSDVPAAHRHGRSRRVSASSDFLWLPLLLLLLGNLPAFGGVAEGQVLQCVGTDGCRCTMDNGSVIDVSSLGNQDGTPSFDNVQGLDFYYYSFNPCYGFTQGSCTDAAVCQISADKQSTYQAGDANSAILSYDGMNAIVYYYSQAPDAFRQSYVTYKCDQAASSPIISVTGESPYGSGTYYLDVTTKCACLDGCSSAGGGGSKSEGGLSAGSVLTIIFFVLLFVYLAAGMVFNKIQRQATGADIIPNVTFWTALPGLIKEGFMFVLGKIRPGRSGYSEV